MAAIRPTASAAAAQMLRSASVAPITRRPNVAAAATLALRRLESSLTPAPPKTAAPVTPRAANNAPDYTAHTDRATSNFTPVPKRVLDGSEDNDVLPAAVLSGAPMELEARTVRIYKPTKPATQSGDWHGTKWRMDWDVLEKGHRWENPLMGWQSSGDFMQGTHIHFKTKEDAIAFAEKQGYEYFVQEPQERKIVPKAYANNFLYSAKKLKHIRTK
ncbi:NADH dehydrogenase (ubiquinone) Fe-S protein 4 [Sporothrix brasiliensis 5110]|uniref:NADH dehydrogenase [ubiquinone] iron-sulfur protein 4, mitochondrial n=1 Tax=Sporothrix brasiliensis 5110 TaxID=1398154 RepID=A0A0C2IZU1_9PEZI|nr:NADH dehydrogenase (ubiquinone) Fe-S protein 4 [Sporothrix brasiliensis 5110]KIH92260.1 NADH dehydrogenase (ubiquinone) Fe-S protein 4 [Sporothrix brasiliensis 5110]